MSSPAQFYKILITLVLFATGLVYALFKDDTPILIESLESKTDQGGPVFNKIFYQPNPDSDIWLMEQSHHGVNSLPEKWDKLAIVVKRGEPGQVAEFYQLRPGVEEISLRLKPIGLKATCFMCHSNGPRAIRPNLNSKQALLSVWDQARIQLWNLRIKSYGPMESRAPAASQKKFRYEHPIANQKLQVQSCTHCHNSESAFGRGELTKQNALAIQFMVEKGFMPPLGFGVSAEDRLALQRFLQL